MSTTILFRKGLKHEEKCRYLYERFLIQIQNVSSTLVTMSCTNVFYNNIIKTNLCYNGRVVLNEVVKKDENIKVKGVILSSLI